MSDNGSEAGRDETQRSAFERRFREAAMRVLRRHGVAEDRLEAEIARLRQAAPSSRLPTVKELEKAFAAGADAR